VRTRDGKGLVVFDVEGVIIPKVRFLFFDVFGRMGPSPFVKGALFGLLYLVGLMSLKGSLRRIFRLLEGLPYERFISLFQAVPLMPEVEEVFRELREGGYKIAFISSGIPRVALRKLADRLGADYISGPEIGVAGGRLSGEVWGDVIEAGGKAAALERLIREEHLESHYRVSVADDRNNLPLYRLCDLNIGYNPDFILSFRADHVVKGGLSGIIPIIRGEPVVRERGLSKNALIRDAIHIGGFSVPIVCAYLAGPHLVALLILLVTLLYAASESMRMFGARLPIISDITSMAAGGSELQEFVTSPIFYALGMIIPLVAFPPPIGYASIAVLTLGDGFASILGRTLGRRNLPFNRDKTAEGSLGGLLLAFLGALLFIEPRGALVAASCGMLAEVLPLPLNDNMAIPLASGLALMALALA